MVTDVVYQEARKGIQTENQSLSKNMLRRYVMAMSTWFNGGMMQLLVADRLRIKPCRPVLGSKQLRDARHRDRNVAVQIHGLEHALLPWPVNPQNSVPRPMTSEFR